MRPYYDAVIVGSGPNGLTAAGVLSRAGHSVLVLEANREIGGGCRTSELTLPGYRHDVCAAVHPMGAASPAFRALRLEACGLEWINPPLAVAHPFDDGSAAVLDRSVENTTRLLGVDAEAWDRMIRPFSPHVTELLEHLLRPIRLPRNPVLMARFGWHAVQSCASLVGSRFRGASARALFAGCAAHSFLPLDAAGSAAFGLVLALAGHTFGWPYARAGSQQIVSALVTRINEAGGEITTSHEVRGLGDVPRSKVVLFDVSPRQLERIAGDSLPARYRDKLRRYRLGPGVFKIDYALSGTIPWKAADCGRAATVHLGGTFEEIARAENAVTHNRVAPRPFVLVAQQSRFDQTRAPQQRHTAWAYCHVPNGDARDWTSAIETQIERFAPGFADVVLARHTHNPAAIEADNQTMIGGDIAGGANDLMQVLFRPFPKLNPYSTPNDRLFLCSSSTPPGGGVHGMCGFWAARMALRRLGAAVAVQHGPIQKIGENQRD